MQIFRVTKTGMVSEELVHACDVDDRGEFNVDQIRRGDELELRRDFFAEARIRYEGRNDYRLAIRGRIEDARDLSTLLKQPLFDWKNSVIAKQNESGQFVFSLSSPPGS